MANVSLKKDFTDGEKLFGQQLNNNFGAIEAALGAMNKITWQDNPDDSIIVYRGTTEAINARDIEDGQILYDTTTGETYIDYEHQRISTGSGNAIHIGSDLPTNPSTQLWINPEEPIQVLGSEVINNMNGTETDKAPSVQSVKSYIDTYADNNRPQILWTNESPTTIFEAQTITLSSDDYDMYEVYFSYNESTAVNYINGFRSVKGKGLIASEIGYSTQTLVRRKVDYVDATHLTISSGYGGTTGDSYLIPIYVIGYKTGLFSSSSEEVEE